MITTHKFNLTPNELFKALLAWTFGRLIWKIYPFIFGLILFVILISPKENPEKMIAEFFYF